MAVNEGDCSESLSQDLAGKEGDIDQSVGEETKLNSVCQNIEETGVDNTAMNKIGNDCERNVCKELKEEGNLNNSAEDDFKECVNTEKSNCKMSECGSSFQDGALRSQAVDEALLEEDEDHVTLSDDENYESAEEEHLTPEEAEKRKNEAMESKTEGNEYFRKQEYAEGKDCYSRAIKRCPKEFTENISIFYANRAACSHKMEDYESAIDDCSKALELLPNYQKARLRRAQCYEKTDKLEEALDDYKIIFESDKSCHSAREAIIRLPEEIKVKHEKLKEEMIGKLKDLGNIVLRPFGLSTENFKLQQDPNSGGYSINFQK